MNDESLAQLAAAVVRDGWNLAPVTSDAGVHVTDVDLVPIKSYEDAYLTAAADHLAVAPWWLRAGGRWLARKVVGRWRSRHSDAPVGHLEKPPEALGEAALVDGLAEARQ